MSFWTEFKNIAIGQLVCPFGGGIAVAISRNTSSHGVSDAKKLTAECNEMTKVMGEIEDDENKYIVEMEYDIEDLNFFKLEEEQELQTLYDEIQALETKKLEGTITEEEEKELSEKYERVGKFGEEYKSKYNTLYNNFISKNNNYVKQFESNINEANNLAKESQDVGTELANTKVSHGVIKKIFGRTKKDKKQAGEKLLNASKELSKSIDSLNDTQSKIKIK